MTEEELVYLMYYLTRENTSQLSFSLSRSDTVTYRDFLSMIGPKDKKAQADKFADVSGTFSGKARLLPPYILGKLFEIFKMEVSFFRVQQSLKNHIILDHGELALRTFHTIAGEDDIIEFHELRDFMGRYQQVLRLDEFKVLCSLVDFDENFTIDKKEFLDILTPFEATLMVNVGDRKYENLVNPRNNVEYEKYINNAYEVYRGEENQKITLDEITKKMIKIVPEYTSKIYTRTLDDPNHPTNRNLYVSDDYKINYDLRKKVINPTETRGFNDFFDPYFKTLCRTEKKEAFEVAKRKVTNELLHQKRMEGYGHPYYDNDQQLHQRRMEGYGHPYYDNHQQPHDSRKAINFNGEITGRAIIDFFNTHDSKLLK